MAGQSNTPELTEERLGHFMRDWGHAWNAHDIETILTMVDDDVVLTDPGLPEPAQGKGQMRAVLEGLWRAMPDFHIDSYTLYLSPDGATDVLTHWRATGTFTGPMDPPGFAPTDGRITMEGATRSRFREGLLCEVHYLYDLMDLGRQLGAAPEPGSKAERLGVFMQRRAARRMRRRNATT
jgi:steroid delta-isomerase-like uncharacterized protein